MRQVALLLLLAFPVLLDGQTDDLAGRQLDAFIDRGMKEWDIPGLAAVVVRDGEVVFIRTAGVSDIRTGDPVNGQTLFAMASTTKAVTALAMAMLVDRGEVSWDDPLSRFIPELRFSDPCLAAEIRIRDLFTHNLGIEAPGVLYMYEISMEELIEKFALIDRAHPVRAGFVYNNAMYALAGEVIRRVSGMDWREFVSRNILDPAGMCRTITSPSGLDTLENHVTSHYDHYERGIIPTWSYLPESFGAAGSMWSCISDMGRYLAFLLNEGVYGKDTLLDRGTFEELFTPRTLITDMDDFYPTHELTRPRWVSYGMGWFQHDYRGTKVDFHTGSLDGLVAINGLMRDRELGVVVFANLDHAEFRHAVMYKAFDLFGFGDDSRDWHTEVYDLYRGIREERLESIRQRDSSRIAEAPMALPLKSYAGTYTHELGGTVVVERSGDGLLLHINGLFHIPASHWHFNTFMTGKEKPFFEGALIRFELNNRGDADVLHLYGLDFTRPND